MSKSTESLSFNAVLIGFGLIAAGVLVMDPAGGFLEERVAFRDRLFVTGAIRSDRNSAFGADFGTVFYPKFSLSWILSEEPFFPRMSWLNSLRLRSAYGAAAPYSTAAARVCPPNP